MLTLEPCLNERLWILYAADTAPAWRAPGAMQALGLSTLAFFAGYPMGRRAGAPATPGVRTNV
jgi:hypothetical protein